MKTLRSGRLFLLAAVGLGTLTTVSLTRADARVDVGLSVGVPLPHGYAEVNVGRDHYYYHRGVFYRPGAHGYYVVHAPRGAIIRDLPPYYSRVYFGGSVYYRYGDVYYQSVPGGYVVVDAPTTTVVTSAPPPPPSAPAPAKEDYQSVWMGDTEFLFKDGQFFKRTPDGVVWAPAPLGAITKSLPNDARSVWYQDIEYYEFDEVYFRKTPDGYKVVDAPWKK
ncbi:MAG TPA: DUF6515 family protein [Candidatus Didemnitutus sp.]|nr:DUF6515 family protein [Candidatus Didemnitutus sp.]